MGKQYCAIPTCARRRSRIGARRRVPAEPPRTSPVDSPSGNDWRTTRPSTSCRRRSWQWRCMSAAQSATTVRSARTSKALQPTGRRSSSGWIGPGNAPPLCTCAWETLAIRTPISGEEGDAAAAWWGRACERARHRSRWVASDCEWIRTGQPARDTKQAGWRPHPISIPFSNVLWSSTSPVVVPTATVTSSVWCCLQHCQRRRPPTWRCDGMCRTPTALRCDAHSRSPANLVPGLHQSWSIPDQRQPPPRLRWQKCVLCSCPSGVFERRITCN